MKNKKFLSAIFAFIAMAVFPFMGYLTAGIAMAETPAAVTLDEESLKKLTTEFEAKGVALRAEFEKQLKDHPKREELTEALKKFTDEELGAIKTEAAKLGVTVTELKTILATQGTELNSLKEKGIVVQQKAQPAGITMREKMATILESIFKSEDFKKFEAANFTGGTQQYTINSKNEVVEKAAYDDEVRKTATAVSTDHTGSILVSEISNNIRAVPVRVSHIRQLMTVRPTDQSSITAPEVYGFTDALTMGAEVLAENTEAGVSNFKTKENTWSLKRIARAMEISKRYFKVNGLGWVINWILNRLPDQLQYVEDFQLLFGDGAGNNVKGIAKEASDLVFDGSFVATKMSSISTYDGDAKTIVTFAAAHGLNSGDKITFAATTGGTYNHEYIINVINEKQIWIDQAYTADAAVADWTATWASYWKGAIDNCTEFDVITIAKAMLNAGEYSATGVVLHTNTAEKIGLIKDLNAGYIGIARDAMGRMVISAMPISVTNAIPAGFAIVGDFQRAVELAEFTPLTIQISEDTTDKKKNQVTIIAEEEIIFPIYNPLWFKYINLSTAMGKIEKA